MAKDPSAAPAAPDPESGHDKIPFGVDAETGETVDVPLSIFKQHGIVRGMTGSGQNLVIVYLRELFIRLTRAAVISVGFGFDFFTSHRLRQAAKEAGRKHCLFSSNSEHDSLPFHPLRAVSPLTEAKITPAVKLTDYCPYQLANAGMRIQAAL